MSPEESPDRAANAAPADFAALVDLLRTSLRTGEESDSGHEKPSANDPRTGSDSRPSIEGARSGDLATRDAAALHEVARALAGAERCVTLLSRSTGDLMNLALSHVLKAEMARAAGLLQLLRLLKGDFAPRTGLVFSGAVVQGVLQSADSEGRLRGITLAASRVDDVGFVADEELLANFLLGVLLMTCALLEGVQNPRVDLMATVSEAGEVALSVTQAQAVPPSGWATRPFGAAMTDVPGGVLGALAMDTGQRLAGAWGGRFAATAGARSTNVTIYLPVIPQGARSAVFAPATSSRSDPGRSGNAGRS